MYIEREREREPESLRQRERDEVSIDAFACVNFKSCGDQDLFSLEANKDSSLPPPWKKQTLMTLS